MKLLMIMFVFGVVNYENVYFHKIPEQGIHQQMNTSEEESNGRIKF